MTLTEQWKKGELPDGLYYCKLACFNYEPTIAKCKSGCIGLASFSKNEEVLAPVPSWEEYLESESHCAVYSNINKWLKKENQQLKDLLNNIDAEYSSGVNKSENKCDEYMIYQSTFTKLDELFYKWEKMREVLK